MNREDYEPRCDRFLQSYVFGEHGDFFVSTAHRTSSASVEPGMMYYETFAWEWNKDKKESGKHIIADNSGAHSPEKARQQHLEVVRQLQDTGEYKELNDE